MNFLEKVPEIYRSGTYLILDFETTNSDKGSALNTKNKLVLACWNFGGKNKHCFGSEYAQEELIRDIKKADYIIAHNAKFELQWLARCGIDTHEVAVYDTMLAEKVILGNRTGSISLAASCARHGIPGKHALGDALVHAGVCASEIPDSILLDYCRQDVGATGELFRRQLRVLNDQELAIVFTRCLLTPVLADIEFNGLGLNRERIDKEYVNLTNRFTDLAARLSVMAPGRNLNSGPQRATYLYTHLGFKECRDFRGNIKKTPGGSPLTDAATIAILKATTQEQKDFQKAYKERAKVQASLSKTIGKLHEYQDTVLRAEFHQARTATGRLSSTGRAPAKIQFQNLAREYKSLFRASRDGWLIGEADAAQLEFRIAAFLSQDTQAKKDIIEGKDIHELTSKILGVSRQKAKEHTFKPLYGGTTGTPKEQKYYAAFREKYPSIYSTQMGWTRTVLETKRLTTDWGFTWYWPDTTIKSTGYITNTSSIFNYPIQALATAEIIPIALVYFWHKIKDLGLKMRIVNTIHDSIICEMPPEEVDKFKEIAVECMADRVFMYLDKIYEMKFNVPLGVSIKIGEHWSEGDETKYETVMKQWSTYE